jgi:iron complex outermembrane receptor protein
MKTISKQSAHAVARRSSAIALAVASILGSAAQAAEGDATSTVLEEIVVTAERRPQNLQDIATSATVLTAESLDKQGVDNVIDIQQVAPGIAINTYNRGTFVNIRGVGIAQSAPTSVPGVATYVDGVYVPHETFISQAFYDVESIEVLRGPQGTLTGQNSTGGAIYIRTPAPVMGQFSGYVDQTAAEYNWYRTVAAVNIPMGSMLAARISGTYNTTDSYTKNIGLIPTGVNPSQPGSSELTSFRAAVRFQPMDILSFDLRYEHFDFKSDYNPIKNRNDAVTPDPFTIEEDARSYLNQDGYRASLEGRWDITSGMQLRAISSKQSADNFDQADGDRTATAPPQPPPTNVGRVGYTQQSTDTNVTEVNLLSTGEQKLSWVVGGFYMTETIPVQVLRDNTHRYDFVVSNSSIIAEAKNKSTSGFGQLDFRFTDLIELNVGARYSEDSQDYTRTALPGLPPSGCFPCTNTAESSETTGKAGAKFHVSDDTMLYLTASKGYKAGGVNLDPRLAVFGPETNTVGEFGVKTTAIGGKLRINGDVFYSKYKDIQISALAPISAGATAPATVNGPEADIYGGELELLGQFGNLGFNLGVSLLHTETTEAQTLTNSSILPSKDLLVPEGTDLPFSPPVTLSAGIEYAAKVGNGTLTPRIQASYIDKQWATLFQADTPLAPTFSAETMTKVPSRTVVDFRLTYAPMKQLQLEAFVTNLLDETYIAVQVQEASSASGGYLYGAPRQIGGRIKYSF